MSAIKALAVSLSIASPAWASPVCWVVEPGKSRLHFTGMQGDTPATGEFGRFSGAFLAAEGAQRRRLWVNVMLDSVETQLPEVNAILRGALFFNARQWPVAGFVSERVEREEEHHYRASGYLTLREVTREVSFEFFFEPRAEQAVLRGESSLKRLDYNVGLGDWRNTDWVANAVKVGAELHLKRAQVESCSPPDM